MSWLQDVKFAARSLRAHLGTSAFAVATLALGLGAALALYAVIQAVLLRALPYADADRIVQVRELAEDGHSMALAWPNYADLAASGVFAATAYHASSHEPIARGAALREGSVAWVGGDFFRLFATAPQLGRSFDAQQRAATVVISHTLWQDLLQGRGDVIGQPLDVGGSAATIIGVMPASFDFPPGTAAWMPFSDAPGTSRSAHNWSVLGRLGEGAALSQARLAAHALATRLLSQYGSEVDLRDFELTPLADAIAAPVRRALLLLAAGTLFLLLIAVTNATNVLLALGGARARELAVRAALGADRLRLARQCLAEGLLITGSAALLALALAWAALRLFVQGGHIELPRASEIGLGADALGVALACALLIALVTTAAVLVARRGPLMAELRESGRGHSSGKPQLRLRSGLLIGQIALTTLLLAAAGLLGRSFLALLAIDPGFDAAGAASVQLSGPSTTTPQAAAANAQRYQRLIDAVGTLPGVSAVGGVNALPLSGSGADGAFWDGSVSDPAHAPAPLGYAQFRVASADYFRAAGIRLLAGRGFDARDRNDGEQVALISAAAARATWGDADPLGRRIQYGNMDGDLHPLTIVGVVADVREQSLDRAPMGSIYVNLAQRPRAAARFSLVVRSSLPLASLLPSLEQALATDAADIPYAIAPLAQMRRAALADRRASLGLLGAFALVALSLASGGLYGLMAFAVGQRHHEFALRQALGATRGRVLRLVLDRGLLLAAGGIAAGIGVAVLGARVLDGQLYGVTGSDPVTLVGVALLLLATTAIACLLPARRACAVAPSDALR